jgi:DNA-binding transcriptional ArsR family regulator
MSINRQFPDYDLDEKLVVTAMAQLRAMSHPLRGTILDLVLERAATVAELAAAVGRPKSTVAHHVKVLADAGMLRVVRTRKRRAIDERFYGRTARIFAVGVVQGAAVDDLLAHGNALSVAAVESVPAYEADRLRTIMRHARIPPESAAEFWARVEAVTREFTQIPRAGDTVFGFAAGLYPTEHPSLPEP